MIADHEKEEDEIMGQADDWIFFALGTTLMIIIKTNFLIRYKSEILRFLFCKNENDYYS